jgi:pre-mRNA-splicing factor ATP-dependent RNA helicase DHX15/PRP43
MFCSSHTRDVDGYRVIVPNVWVRPNNQRREADTAKALLTVPDGDHLTMLNVYNQYSLSTPKSFIFLPSLKLFLLAQTNTIKTGHGQITSTAVP